jgi:AraC family transcriptional regulator
LALRTSDPLERPAWENALPGRKPSPPPVPTNRALPAIRPYEIVSESSIRGTWFRVESQTQDVAGHRDFDLRRLEHHLTLTPEGHPTWVSARVDGTPLERFSLVPGQLTLLPAGQRIHGYADGLGEREEVRLSFEPEFVRHAVALDVNPSRLCLLRSMDLRNPIILQALAALGREARHPGPMGRAYAESLVLLTVIELVRHHSTLAAAANRRAAGLPSGRLRRVIDYIEAHLGEQVSLLTLAAEAGVSAAHLARVFKRAMGRSVHRYLLDRRVEWAAALLGGTDRAIAEVAQVTGFSSQAHLTTAFHRLNRTTPAAYRRHRRR